ncbi:biopolymer transporter ExbD [Luteimonas vadosa]
MLVLLIIFMVASPALTRQIDLTLPRTDRERQARVEPPPIRLRIDGAGQVYWNDSATPLSALQAMMSSEVARDAGAMPRLEVDANGDSDYQVVASVLAAAQNAGMARVAFARK